ncbi:MAG: hypothetical protein OXD34_09285 [bacterium]|nr:hypothetical protein [bacterium]
MGVFNQTIQLAAVEGGRSLDFDAMVDTGASYTIVPAGMLNGLGVLPIDKLRLVLADGRRVEYDLGRAFATIDGRTELTLVLFGEENTSPLLGAYTLEGLRLAADPVHQRLVPAVGWA